jgi:endonuclease/exonuclease/phosphatase family metal-dependent hydrolase
VWTADARQLLVEAGRKAGLVHSFGHASDDTGGLLLLSRLPILEATFEAFSVRGEPAMVVTNLEYVAGKGFARVRLKTPDGPLDLINTHLHARYTSRSQNGSLPHRIGQAIQLAARVTDSDVPTVAVGDFNFLEGELDYRVLTEILGLSDVAAALDHRQATTLRGPYRPAKRFERRKDFVFARDGRTLGIEAKRITREFDETLDFDGHAGAYSNHAGLIAEFDFGDPATRLAVAPSRSIFDEISTVLAEGERAVRSRRDTDRALSGVGLGLAAVAGIGMVPRNLGRRRFLRLGLGGVALLALTPSIGLSVASEILLPDQLVAFREAARQLAQLDPSRDAVALSS